MNSRKKNNTLLALSKQMENKNKIDQQELSCTAMELYFRVSKAW
jgi:hypothetical protein